MSTHHLFHRFVKNGKTYWGLGLVAQELGVSIGVVHEAIRSTVIKGWLYADESWFVADEEVERLFYESLTRGQTLEAFLNDGLPAVHEDSYSVPRVAVYAGVVHVSFQEAADMLGVAYGSVRHMAQQRRFKTLQVIGSHRYITRREIRCLQSRVGKRGCPRWLTRAVAKNLAKG